MEDGKNGENHYENFNIESRNTEKNIRKSQTNLRLEILLYSFNRKESRIIVNIYAVKR